MTNNYYLPILKAKLGEFIALSKLKESLKDLIIPLFEITPLEYDFDSGNKAKTMDQHLNRFCEKLRKHWNRNNCFLDTHLIQSEKVENLTCLEYVFQTLKPLKLTPTPVVHLTAPHDVLKATETILRTFSITEIGLRVCPDDVTSPDFSNDVDSLLKKLKIKPDQCHLIFDLKDADFNNVEDISDGLLGILEDFPRLAEWKAFAICGSAFPSTASIKGPEAEIARNDWKFYNLLVRKIHGKSFARKINYGDYSIVSPKYFEFNPKTMSSSANIRYAHNEIWYVLKGKALKKAADWLQYKDQAKKLMKSSYFLGVNFSAGDQHVSKCVKGEVKPGNTTVWNWVGNNHHFTKVLLDLFSNAVGS